MGTVAPDRSAVVCSWTHQGSVGCSQRCCSSTPTGAGKPPQERDAWCQLLAKWLKVSAIHERPVRRYSEVFRFGGQKGRISLLWLTFSSRWSFLLLRWKTADTVFVLLNFSFQVWRYSPAVAMSLLNTLPLPASLHQHAWLLNRQHMYTFWTQWLSGQTCRCWREGVPGQIPVGRRYWECYRFFSRWLRTYLHLLFPTAELRHRPLNFFSCHGHNFYKKYISGIILLYINLELGHLLGKEDKVSLHGQMWLYLWLLLICIAFSFAFSLICMCAISTVSYGVGGVCRRWPNKRFEPGGKFRWSCKGPTSQHSENSWEMIVNLNVDVHTKTWNHRKTLRKISEKRKIATT